MREILSTLKSRDKLAIVFSMSGLAVILASIMIAFSFCSASRHEHRFDYWLEYRDGHFNVVGYCGIADCPAPEYFEENVQGVSLLSAERATCAKEGKRVYAYTMGDVSLQYVEKIPVAPHAYDCDNMEVDKGKVTLTCTQSGCPNPVLALENVTSIKLDHYIEGDCFSPRQAVYTYVSKSQTGNFVTLINGSNPHTLAGKPANKLENADGTYKYGQQGIKLFDATTPVACGSVTNGYYVCEKCVQVVVVKVKKPDHNLVYSASDLVEPTVTGAGYVNTHCNSDGCAYTDKVELPMIVIGFNAEILKEATEEAPMLVLYTHDYSYGFTVELEISVGSPIIHHYSFELMLVPKGDGFGQFNLVGKCSDAVCSNPVVTIEDVSVKAINPLCTDNYMVYGYEYKGTVYEIKMSRDPGTHKFSYNIDEATLPTEDTEGEIVVTCGKLDCSYTKTVTLPKIEIGVNTTVVVDAATYTWLEYKYETDEGCVITIPITIYK